MIGSHSASASPSVDAYRMFCSRVNVWRFMVVVISVELLLWQLPATRKILPLLMPVVELIQPLDHPLTHSNPNRKQHNPKFRSGPNTQHAEFIPSSALQSDNFASLVHCVGDNWEPNSYLFRSCQLRNLCWDQQHEEFVLFPSQTQHDLDHHVANIWRHPYARISTLMTSVTKTTTTNSTSTTKIDNTNTSLPETPSFYLRVLPMGQRSGFTNFPWFPRKIEANQEKDSLLSQGYWQLKDNVVLIPLYLPTITKPKAKSFKFVGNNTPQQQPTDKDYESLHLYQPPPSIWSLLTETLYPMYTLLSIFHMLNSTIDTTVLVQFLPPQQNEEECLNNSSSFSANLPKTFCFPPDNRWWQSALHDFLSWSTLGLDDSRNRSLSDTWKFPHPSVQSSPSSLICAKRGVAGMGSLTDHGTELGHGAHGNEYRFPAQVGRGRQWWDFRNYILQQKNKIEGGIDIKQNESPHFFRVVLSLPPTMLLGLTLAKELRGPLHEYIRQSKKLSITAARERMHSENSSLVYLTNDFPSCSEDSSEFLSKTACIRVASQSRFFITLADKFDAKFGDYSAESLFWSALFLPRGATLILYYDESTRVHHKRGSSRPRILHFNVWNNLSYLKVHWLPMHNPKTEGEITDDIQIVRSLMEIEMQLLLEANDEHQNHNVHQGSPRGSFNGFNLLAAKNVPFPSTLHCVGDNVNPLSNAISQSCHIQQMCLHFDGKNDSFFFATPSRRQQQLSDRLLQWKHPHALISTDAQVYPKRVTVGRVYAFSSDSEWFPEVLNEEKFNSTMPRDESQYFQLPDDVVWLPLFPHHQYLHNPGHVLWDLFLPIFTLISMFDLEKRSLLLTLLDPGMSVNSTRKSFKTITRLLPMIGVPPESFRNLKETQLVSQNNNKQSNSVVVCGADAVLGMGMLTDHGVKQHGLLKKDYRFMHNTGRGVHFFNFRNFILRNMKIDFLVKPQMTPPYQVIFSIHSSTQQVRRKGFSMQISYVKSSFSADLLSVQALETHTLPLSRQLKVMTETSIFVSVIGGATMTGIFLPPGACIILYFNDVADDFVRRSKDRPNMMDFDFWNNASYLRVHWLPTKTMDDKIDLETLRLLIQLETHFLSSQ